MMRDVRHIDSERKIIDYLSHCKNNAYFDSLMHSLMAKYVKLINHCLTIPLIILNAISGAGMFVAPIEEPMWQLIIGCINIVSVVVMGVNKYLRLDERYQKHMHLSYMYGSIYRKVCYFINKSSTYDELVIYMESINFKINTVNEMSIPCCWMARRNANVQIADEKKSNNTYFTRQTHMRANKYKNKQIDHLNQFDVELLRDVARDHQQKLQTDNKGTLVNTDVKNMNRETLMNYLTIDLNVQYDDILTSVYKIQMSPNDDVALRLAGYDDHEEGVVKKNGYSCVVNELSSKKSRN